MDEIDKNIQHCPDFYCKCIADDSDFLKYDAVICGESGTFELMAYEEFRECMRDQMRCYEIDRINGTR